MLTRFINWLLRRTPAVEDLLDVYQPRERAIYRYFDGQKQVSADPLALHYRYCDRSGDLGVMARVANSICKDAGKAFLDVVRYIREIFELKPVAEGGLTDNEAVELLAHFLRYIETVKKNSPPSSMSAPATSAPSAPSSDAGPPSPNTPVSPSTDAGLPPTLPTTSPGES